MVVLAIMMMAMGIMTPTLIEFFKNQKLKNVRTHFSSALGVARLMAITEGTPVQVVFFYEGVRTYHVRNKAFRREEEFIPEAAPGASPTVTFELRFAHLKNTDLIKYRDWERTQPDLNAAASTPGAGQCSVADLVALEYQRDGTVRWLRGENVASNLYDRGEDADIIVRQEGNPESLFIDIKQTGQIRTNFIYSSESRRS
jgi:hypothetical protein